MFKKNRYSIFLSFSFTIIFFFCFFLVPGSGEETNPVADAEAVIVFGKARFTVLTPQLIRMEWSKDSRFEDQASLVFINRHLPVPRYSKRVEGSWLFIQTEKLSLKYKKDSGKFTEDNLSIQFDLLGKRVTWYPGKEDKGNLRGTTRTLDGVEGATSLEKGVLSRDGWVLVDDSRRPLFDDSDWPWAVARPEGENQDWYFFGYGHEYKKALGDFIKVAGRIPIPPRFAFGLWWSRYWSYTDQEFRQLVQEFEIHDVPLDVLVIDMDWHLTFNLRWDKKVPDQSGHRLGWSGYTWDRVLFPEPEYFLAWCEKKGLKTPLNLHPASGVQPHEERYPEMARAMGIDPSSKKYISFDIANKKFATNYLQILHYPLEKQGVDFWWIDWQQNPMTEIPGLNNTLWLNYVHFTDMERRGKRPLILHRWGGLGNHRYQIGFSGDTISVWDSLAFQAYFTATASNVCYGYWSHDIGGHMPGKVSPELYTRWIQYGVFSPILRTHTTKNPEAERRIWAYHVDYFLIMRDSFLLRYALIPYIYSAAREAYDTGVSLCRPMYYDYPEAKEAYEFQDQYMFGNDILVAPISSPVSPANMDASKIVWLPEGRWIEWFTGNLFEGPDRIERGFALDESPVYVKAGAIIPMQPKMRHTGENPVDPLILTILPGDSGRVRVYEDQGSSLGYKKGEYAWTEVHHLSLGEGQKRIEIFPVEGHYPAMNKERSYEIHMPLAWPPEKVTCNGKPIEYSRKEQPSRWSYEGDRVTLIISLPKFKSSEKVEILIDFPAPLEKHRQLLDGFYGKVSRLKRVVPLCNSLWPKEWSPEILLEAVQTGNRISLNPRAAFDELRRFKRILPDVIRQIEALKEVNEEVISKVLGHLQSLK